MQHVLLEIVRAVKEQGPLDTKSLLAIIRAHNQNIPCSKDHVSKKKLMPYFLSIKAKQSEAYFELELDGASHKALVQTLQIKPRRTASGVATITVITKPWACSSNCIYCPSDVRMPKSYLSDEPACQRAERNFFDPYLQVASRLGVLSDMGHITDKVELIILGGTWTDYPQSYQRWFVSELFRALNDTPRMRAENCAQRRGWYENLGISAEKQDCITRTQEIQSQVAAGSLSFNAAITKLYTQGAWAQASKLQDASLEDVFVQHKANEAAQHRVVGLVMETQPDSITPQALRLMRQLGATKVQIGIQSLQEPILRANKRYISLDQIRQAFALLRLYGFKIHAHAMSNLMGSTPDQDRADFCTLVKHPDFIPDEIKLYPCALIKGTALVSAFESGAWQPYSEPELINLLADNILDTPPYIRISRMIRDFSAHDIQEGNKKVNLRQLVEARAQNQNLPIKEMRFREISTQTPASTDLYLKEHSYLTQVSCERFLEWVDNEGRLAGFLRLSLPFPQAVQAQHDASLTAASDIATNTAMIREVHIYGRVAGIAQNSLGAQHLGLGKKLVAQAEIIAKQAGYDKLRVISAIGTRLYYESLGFSPDGLYHAKDL